MKLALNEYITSDYSCIKKSTDGKNYHTKVLVDTGGVFL